MQKKIIFSVLFILFVLDLFFIWNDTPTLRFFTKPLLIPTLLLGYLFELKSKQIKLNFWFVLGLVFSFFGDLFLLFSWGFILGLGSFLLAHIFYIICLNKFKINNSWTFLPFVLVYLIRTKRTIAIMNPMPNLNIPYNIFFSFLTVPAPGVETFPELGLAHLRLENRKG